MLVSTDIIDLTRFLDLDTEEAMTGSLLWCKLTVVESEDISKNLNFLSEISLAIAELRSIESKITKLQSGRFYGANEVSEDIDGDYSYSVKYTKGSGLEKGLKTRYRYLVSRIKKILRWESECNRIKLG